MKNVINDPIAIMGISNNISLLIYEVINDIDDFIICRFECADVRPKKLTRHKIKYTKRGNPYFTKYGKRYHLDQFISVQNY